METVGINHKTRMRKFALTGSAIMMVAFLAYAPAVLAQGGLSAVNAGLENAAKTSGLATTQKDLPTVLGSIINSVLGLLGILLLGYLLYGGFLWMTSGDSENGAKKAKTTITNAVIGLLIIALSYTVAMFVMNALISATTGTSVKTI